MTGARVLDEDARRILAKIQKLLRLAQSANEFEAALAAERAQALLDKYKLAQADIPADQPEGVDAQTFPWLGRTFGSWALRLLVVVCRTTYCQCLYHSYAKTYTVIGKSADVAVVQELYVYLYREVDRLQRGFTPDPTERPSWERRASHTRLARLSFALGCVHRVGERLRAAVAARQAATPALNALMVVEQRAVTQYVAQHYPNLQPSRHGQVSYYARSYAAGQVAGASVRIAGVRKELA